MVFHNSHTVDYNAPNLIESGVSTSKHKTAYHSFMKSLKVQSEANSLEQWTYLRCIPCFYALDP